MELHLSTSLFLTPNHQLVHSTPKFTLKLTPQNIHFSLNFKTSSSYSSPPSKTTLLRQPEYPNRPISTDHESDPFPIDTDNTSTVLDVLRLFDSLSLTVTPDIYASLVDECTRKQDTVMASELCAHMKGNYKFVKYLRGSSGLLLLNRILMMLVSCECLEFAHRVFDEMPHRNSISLAILIAGLVKNKLFERCLDLFVRMYECFVGEDSCLPLRVVVVCVLKGCVRLKDVSLGKMIHGWLLKMGYGRELFVGIALVEFYGKCGCLPEANRMFCEHIRLDGCQCTTLWTEAIVNNCSEGCFEEVIHLFQEMGMAGVRINESTISSTLKACGRVSDDGTFGRQVHGMAIKLALETHASMESGLVDMYARCGLLKDARKVFNMTANMKRSRSCWNAMISGLMQHGMFIEAIKMLYRMKVAGLQPKQSVIDQVRMACGSLNLEMGSDRAESW